MSCSLRLFNWSLQYSPQSCQKDPFKSKGRFPALHSDGLFISLLADGFLIVLTCQAQFALGPPLLIFSCSSHAHVAAAIIFCGPRLMSRPQRSRLGPSSLMVSPIMLETKGIYLFTFTIPFTKWTPRGGKHLVFMTLFPRALNKYLMKMTFSF